MRMPTALLAIALIAILVACQGETVTVEVPADTPTPQPTYTPYPTLEALPTYTPLPPLPTNTPYPTFTPQPTYTPAPTPAPVIETVIERDRWTPYYLDETVVYVVVGDVGEHSLQGGWLLQLTCSTENKPGVYIERASGLIFVDGAQSEDTLLVSVDGSTGEHTWFYFPPDDIFFKDFYSAGWGENLVSRLLEAETVVITVPTGDNDYVITFDVAGLDQHIDVPQDLCEG